MISFFLYIHSPPTMKSCTQPSKNWYHQEHTTTHTIVDVTWGWFQRVHAGTPVLTLPMLRLLLSKAQRWKNLWKQSKPCHVGIHWIALDEYSQMSTHMPGFRSFFRFLHHFVLAKWATSSIRVKACSAHLARLALLTLSYQRGWWL